MNTAQWQTVTEDVTYIDFPFRVTHHFVSHDAKQAGGDCDSSTDENAEEAELVDSWTGVSRSVQGMPTALIV